MIVVAWNSSYKRESDKKSKLETYPRIFAGEVVKLVNSKNACCSEVSPWVVILEAEAPPEFMLHIGSLQVLDDLLRLIQGDIIVLVRELDNNFRFAFFHRSAAVKRLPDLVLDFATFHEGLSESAQTCFVLLALFVVREDILEPNGVVSLELLWLQVRFGRKLGEYLVADSLHILMLLGLLSLSVLHLKEILPLLLANIVFFFFLEIGSVHELITLSLWRFRD